MILRLLQYIVNVTSRLRLISFAISHHIFRVGQQFLWIANNRSNIQLEVVAIARDYDYYWTHACNCFVHRHSAGVRFTSRKVGRFCVILCLRTNAYIDMYASIYSSKKAKRIFLRQNNITLIHILTAFFCNIWVGLSAIISCRSEKRMPKKTIPIYLFYKTASYAHEVSTLKRSF